jgi:hypothetical protein
MLEQAVTIHHTAGDQLGEAQDLRYAGVAYARAGDTANARERWERAYRIFRRLEFEVQAAQLRSHLAELGPLSAGA